MKVQIENNLFLESDERQFILKEYSGKKDKDGKETFKILGFFGTAQQALKAFARMKIKQSTAVTLSELVLDVNRIEEYISSKITV
jgi:molybdopterin/thiamine biosynthesis adenylyltransferase